MEAQLASLNSKMEQMSLELKGVKTDLANISLSCKTLRDEFSGFSGVGDDVCVGLAEKTSTKQILEEILYEIKAVKKNQLENARAVGPKPELEQTDTETFQGDEVAEALKLLRRKPGVSTAGDPESALEFPVVEIAFPQGEQNYWIDELRKLKKRLRVPTCGMTMSPGRNHLSYLGTAIVNVVISNYSTSELSEPRLHQFAATPSNGSSPVGNVIPAQTKDVLSFGVISGSTYSVSGMCSYRINSTNMRLVVYFDHNHYRHCKFDIYAPPSSTEYTYGVAFIPDNIAADYTAVSKVMASTDYLTRAEISTVKIPCYKLNQFDELIPKPSPPGPRAIKYNNLAALATLTKHKEDTSLLIEVDFMDCLSRVNKSATARKYLSKRPIEDGLTMFDTIHLDDIRSCIQEKYGCVIEITNRLNVSLEEFDSYIAKPVKHVLPPSVIPGFTREKFHATSDSITEGMFLYCIGTTDFQIDAGFRVKPESNSFAIKFSRRGSPADLFTSSFPPMASWNTLPYIFADATDGEQQLEYSNLRITASMTCGEKAILKIIVSAF